VALRRNNIYGDGDEGSFDHLVLPPPPALFLLFRSFALSLNIAIVPGLWETRHCSRSASPREIQYNPAWTGKDLSPPSPVLWISTVVTVNCMSTVCRGPIVLECVAAPK
jgi:hypothetical protein